LKRATAILVGSMAAACWASCRGAGTAQPSQARTEPERTAATTDLERFQSERPFLGPDWHAVELDFSQAKHGPLRVYFDKRAVSRALVEFAKLDTTSPTPLPYAEGTCFVAQRLDWARRVVETQVLIAHPGGEPEFLAFDARGKHAPPTLDCRACHLGAERFEPSSTYPNEALAFEIRVGERTRSRACAERLAEAQTRSAGTFGPWGALLLGWLRAGQATSALDAQLARDLAQSFPDLFAGHAALLTASSSR
jgi:hypothetical protein